MIYEIFKKYSQTSKRKKIIITIINSLHINDSQKNLYLESLDFLDLEWLDQLYNSLQEFIWEIEKTNLEDIRNENFTQISGLRKKEAVEKQKDINSFWFLLNNL